MFGPSGSAAIKDSVSTFPILGLFAGCDIDETSQFNGMVYLAKGKGSRSRSVSRYEISERGDKIRANPKSEAKDRVAYSGTAITPGKY